jgi:hypothetical protein
MLDHMGLLDYGCGLSYLDDIIIWSDSIEEHMKHLCLVLEALQ